MKTLYTLLAFSAVGMLQAQSIFIEPWPIVPGEPSKLYVDITSQECGCPELQDADPINNLLYIWTWGPNESRPDINGVNVTNGAWNASNHNLVMQQDTDNPNLWYYDFIGVPILEFYDVPQEGAQSIEFLLKEFDGAGAPEQKSVDMSIALEFEDASDVNDFDRNVAAFEVFPNPTSGMVRVKTILTDGIYGGHNLRVMTIEGRMVFEESGMNTLSAGVEIDMGTLSSGIYMVQLSKDDRVLATQKLVVK